MRHYQSIPLRCSHQENSLNINHLCCPAFFLKNSFWLSAKFDKLVASGKEEKTIGFKEQKRFGRSA
jgi:hypothetical protein